MTTKYLLLKPESSLPDISLLNPFRCVVIADEAVSPEWQEQVSDWLVKSGCKYMMAWGKKCSSWDDSVDLAILKKFHYGEISDDNFVMTTWHEMGGEAIRVLLDHPNVEIAWITSRGDKPVEYFHRNLIGRKKKTNIILLARKQ